MLFLLLSSHAITVLSLSVRSELSSHKHSDNTTCYASFILNPQQKGDFSKTIAKLIAFKIESKSCKNKNT